jgi:hypothetical protein
LADYEQHVRWTDYCGTIQAAGLKMVGNGKITVSITSLSDAELIRILQHEDLDDDMTQFVEAEIARRKMEGVPNN